MYKVIVNKETSEYNKITFSFNSFVECAAFVRIVLDSYEKTEINYKGEKEDVKLVVTIVKEDENKTETKESEEK